MEIINARVKQKTDTEANWLANPLILLNGEQAFVVNGEGLPVNFKIGDGTKTFAELPYYFDYGKEASMGGVAPNTSFVPEIGSAGNPAIYFATPGTYPGFGGITLTEPLNVISWNGSAAVVKGVPIEVPEPENKIKEWVAGTYTDEAQTIRNSKIWQLKAGEVADMNEVPGTSPKWEAKLVSKNDFFPFSSFSNVSQAEIINKAVKDFVITNADPTKFYSLTNIEVLAGGDIAVRTHHADSDTGTEAQIFINQTFTSADSGVQLITGSRGAVIHKMLIDVDYLKTLPVGKVGDFWAGSYPLSKLVTQGTGTGLIVANESKTSIGDIQTSLRLQFPYASYIDIGRTTILSKVVKDLVIVNANPAKHYSLTNVEILADGRMFVRVHASDTTTGAGAVLALVANLTQDDSGMVLVEGTYQSSFIRMLIDVDYLKTLTVQKIGDFWPNSYPLATVITQGLGTGLIREADKLFAKNTLYKSFRLRNGIEIMNNAIKDLLISNPASGKFYSLTNIEVLSDGRMVVRVHESTSAAGAGAFAVINKAFLPTESGIKVVTGTRNGATIKVAVDVDYLKTLSVGKVGDFYANNYPLDDLVFGLSSIDAKYNVQQPRIVDLKAKSLPYLEPIDSCVPILAKEVSRVNNPFIQHETLPDSYNRSNSATEFYVEADGTINLEVFLYSDVSKSIDNGINSYMTDVKFPVMPNVQSMIDRQAMFPYREPVALDLIHPEIVDTGATMVGGYRYWACASNLPAGEAKIEDEVVFVSNDFTDWKRIRAFTETFNPAIHAVDLVLPPHDLVPVGTVTYDMLLPVPQPESGTFTVNGSPQVVKSYLKHDPVMVFDADDDAVYFILTYNLKFVGDETPALHNASNQFTVCIRTTNGINWEVVRQDGSTLALATPADSRLMFTQTGGKNNYLRHRDHMGQQLGNSICKHNGEWYWFYGVNGGTVYKGDKVYSADLQTHLNYKPENSDGFNHPSHFSYNGNIYRWGVAGLSRLNLSTYTWTLLPINSTFRGFRGEGRQYKKSMWVNPDGTGVFIVADRRDESRDLINWVNFNSEKATPVTIGKVDVAKMIASAEEVKRGFYFSFEVVHYMKNRVALYRVPFATKSTAREYIKEVLLQNLDVKIGDRIYIDASTISYGDVTAGTSGVIVKYL